MKWKEHILTRNAKSGVGNEFSNWGDTKQFMAFFCLYSGNLCSYIIWCSLVPTRFICHCILGICLHHYSARPFPLRCPSSLILLFLSSAAAHFRLKEYQTSAELFEKAMLYVPSGVANRILRAKGYRVLCLCHLGLSQLDEAWEYIDEAEKVLMLICTCSKFDLRCKIKFFLCFMLHLWFLSCFWIPFSFSAAGAKYSLCIFEGSFTSFFWLYFCCEEIIIALS